jgi:hypothetical protein
MSYVQPALILKLNYYYTIKLLNNWIFSHNLRKLFKYSF